MKLPAGYTSNENIMRALVTVLICLPLAAQPASEETAVRDVVKRYVEAREKQDPAATKALFTDDADQLVSSGEWRRGLAEVVKGTMASSRNNSGHRTIVVETVRFLTADVAVADGRYELAGTGGAETRRMWTTLILKRTGQGWRIAAIRNMLPASAAR